MMLNTLHVQKYVDTCTYKTVTPCLLMCTGFRLVELASFRHQNITGVQH